MSLDDARALAGIFLIIFCIYLSVVISNTNPTRSSNEAAGGDVNWTATGMFVGIWLITFLFYLALKLWGIA